MNWSTTLREADVSADAHLCSVPPRGVIESSARPAFGVNVFQVKST